MHEEKKKKERKKNLCMAHKMYMHRSFFHLSFEIAFQHSFFGHIHTLYLPVFCIFVPRCTHNRKGTILNIIACYFFSFSVNEKLKSKMYHLLCLCSFLVDSISLCFIIHSLFWRLCEIFRSACAVWNKNASRSEIWRYLLMNKFLKEEIIKHEP